MCLKTKKIISALLAVLFSFVVLVNVSAADINVNLTSTKQIIKGFGGINHPAWIGDLTESQRLTAFGNGDGQIGMSILRVYVNDNSNNWYQDVATAKRAIELGATVFASPWNPPSNMTETVNGKKRLRYDMYDDYTDHLNNFISYMKQNGVDLYAISVQNEPDYAHEWTWWSANEILTYMKNNAGNLQTRVMAPESFQYIKSMSDPILNDPQALANLDILGAHLYGTQLSNFPYPLFKQKGQGKELWMTEVYTDSNNDADLWPTALDVAYNIHNSMVEAEFSAYVWWYIRRSYGMIKENGQISKRGYCMSQFSKFIRPGYYRVDATKRPATDVYASAYKSDENVVVVVVNRSNSSKTLSLGLSGSDAQSLTKYTTSGSKSMRNDGLVYASNGAFSVSLDAQSVSTFVGPLSLVTPTPLVTPAPEQNPVWTGGPYELDGSSDYYDIPDGITESLGDFSAACWVKLDSLDNWTRVFDFGGDSNVFMMLTPVSGSTGYPYFTITISGNDGEQGINGTSALPTGSWQHLAVVKTGDTGILYVNGQEVGRNTSMTLKPADLGNTTNNFIGRSQWEHDPYLSGEVDLFNFYNRAISSSEVSSLSGNPPGTTTKVTGDVNGSGSADIVDALMIAQYYVGLNPQGFIAANADANCDGTISIVDALVVAQYYVGLVSGFSC